MAIYIPPRGTKKPGDPPPGKKVPVLPKAGGRKEADYSSFNKQVLPETQAAQEDEWPSHLFEDKPERTARAGPGLVGSTALSRIAPKPKMRPVLPPPVLPIPPEELSGVSLTVKQLLKQHPLPPLPTGAPFILYDWQIEDIETLIQWARVGVFLPVGAGKTVIGTLVALAWGDRYRIVVIPPILIRQWVRWLNSIPDSGGAVAYAGPPKERHAIDITQYSWLVMSDGIFRNDLSRLTEYMAGEECTTLKDEAQGIKNTASATFQAIEKFSNGRKLLMMTGTELNSPADAYAYIKLKTPLLYRGWGQFANIHIAKFDFFDKPEEWQHLELLNKNLYLQSVQRRKEDIHAHLEKARYLPFEYDLDPKHKKLYDQLTEEQIIEIESGGKWDATTSQSIYNLSQQIILNWGEFAGKDDLRPAAFDVIDSIVEQTNLGRPGASKLIIWTWFKMSTRVVKAYMETLFPDQVAVAFSESNSAKEVERFMDDPNCVVLVAQPGSAGAGLNPQYICWYSLFLETPTRTIPFRQAAGRIDREGQAQQAIIWVAMASGTIQTSLYDNLLHNDELVQRVQGNPHDLRKLLRGG